MWVLVHIFHLGHVLPEGLRDTRALILGVVPEQASLLVVDAAHRQAQVLVRDDRVRRLRTVKAGGKFFLREFWDGALSFSVGCLDSYMPENTETKSGDPNMNHCKQGRGQVVVGRQSARARGRFPSGRVRDILG